MKIVLFDLETNGLLDEMTEIHCAAAATIDSVEPLGYRSQDELREFLELLDSADRIVAHNAIGFDIPALKKIYGWEPKCEVYDTLIMARAMWNNISDSDFGRIKKGFPARLRGSHGLEAYGYRLKVLKGDYGKQANAWGVFTEEMLEYCVQDVVVLKALYEKQMKLEPDPRFVELENKFAKILSKQEQVGVRFDNDAAEQLMVTLRIKKMELEKELKEVFPPQYEPESLGESFVCKVRSKRYPGMTKGAEFCKIKLVEFNPGSRQQIAERLMKKYGWNPTDHTDKGGIKINETILEAMEYPEAKLLAEYFTIAKRLSQLADGTQAWIKLQQKGRLHGRVNTGGAVTGRCTHSSPNLAQVPAGYSPFGKECRSLFIPSEGYKMVGCDASGLELRCLAHYLARFDGGEYADIVLHGDIHTANQQAAGLETRNQAKTFCYAWLYGAGAVKIGSIVGGGAKEGAILQKKFMTAFPAVKKLKEGIAKAVGMNKFLRGLDGRKLPIRSEHSALNVLLQSAGALIMKRFAIELYERCVGEGWTFGNEFAFVLNIHDEIDAEVKPEYIEKYSEFVHQSFKAAGDYFKFRIPIEGDVKVGNNWHEIH